jgi:hypothetical protein
MKKKYIVMIVVAIIIVAEIFPMAVRLIVDTIISDQNQIINNNAYLYSPVVAYLVFY